MSDLEDQFSASLDAINRGESPLTKQDLAEFAAMVHAVASPQLAPNLHHLPPRLTSADRGRMWTFLEKEFHTESATSRARSSSMSSPHLAIPPYAQSGGKRSTFDRWQSMISFAIMLAVLGGLFAVVYQRGMRGPDPEPTMLAALADESTPHPIESIDFSPECVAQESSEEAEQAGSYPIPNYSPAVLWIGDPQIDIAQTFLIYLHCQDERGTDAEPTEAEQSFLSPRLLSLMGIGGDSTDQSPAGEIFDPIQRIISDFPLPLNALPPYSDEDLEALGIAHDPFDYWMIHHLPNERWAVMSGTVSTHMLQTGEPIRTGDGELAYISFIPQGDGYVIDEYFLICPSDIVASLDDENDPIMNPEPFDPAELIRNPEATCG